MNEDVILLNSCTYERQSSHQRHRYTVSSPNIRFRLWNIIADEYKEFCVAFNWLSSEKISELSQLSATQNSSELAEERSAEVSVADLDERCLETAILYFTGR